MRPARTALLIVVVMAWGRAAAAEQPPKGLPKWDMDEVYQKPTPDHQRLFYWIGDWTSEEEYPPTPYMPAGGKGSGRFRFTVDHDLWVRLEYDSIAGPEHDKRALGYMCVWGYDRYTKRYEQWLYHHMGSVEHSVGEWRGDHFYFESRSPIGGLPHRSRYHFTPISDDKWTFFAEETFDLVKWIPTFRATLTRVGGHMPRAQHAEQTGQPRGPQVAGAVPLR